MNLPLENLVVVELGHSVAAPVAGLILAELGATVMKVENSDGGDDARNWGPPFLHGAAGMVLMLVALLFFFFLDWLLDKWLPGQPQARS